MELAEYDNNVSSASTSVEEDCGNFQVKQYCNNKLNSQISVISDGAKEENRCFATSYENVDLVKSHKNHIGTKIIPNNITLVFPNKDDNGVHVAENKTAKAEEETSLEQKRKKKVHIVIGVCALMLTAPLVVSIVTINSDTQKFNESIWLVTREMWGAVAPNLCVALHPYTYLIMIDQTGYNYCQTYFECCDEMRQIQKKHMAVDNDGYVLSDVNYNFVIGGDGRVYEGRAWNCTTQTRYTYDQLLSIAFVGDYFTNSTNNTVTEKQMKALFSLIDFGIKASKVLGGYAFVPVCCYKRTIISPGDNLYNIIEKTGSFTTACNTFEPCDLIQNMTLSN